MQYRKYEIEDAEKAALKLPKLQLLKEVRFIPMLCCDCKKRGIIGGSAMTNWTCPGCNRPQISGSTATGVLCNYCAFVKFSCTNCGESLDKDL